jgi:nitroreductase
METSSELQHDTMTLREAVEMRHASRAFLATPVPRSELEAALNLAARAPSNSNTQPWRLFLLSGEPLDRLKAALLTAASASPNGPERAIPPLPPHYEPLRQALAAELFGKGLGIAREDAAGRAAAVLQMFGFFGAPAAAVVCVDEALGRPDAMGVGMYLQTLLLSLTARGIGSCAEVAVAVRLYQYQAISLRNLGVSAH